MRAIILSTEFPPLIGGIGTFACGLALALKKVGVEVRVITTVGRLAEEVVRDFAVIRARGIWNVRFLKAVPLLMLTAIWGLRERPRWIVAMTWTHEGLVAYLLRKALSIRYVVVTHGSEILAHRERALIRSLRLLILRNADGIVANSRFTENLVVSLGIDPNRVTIVHPPLVRLRRECEMIRPGCDELFGLCEKRVMFTAARLVRRKGHAQVIRALGLLRQRYPDLVYVMTGEGEYVKELSDLAHSCDVRDQVRMIGFVSSEQLSQLFWRAEFYICPAQVDGSDVEGFGIGIAEAAAFGKPVIAGRSGGVGEVVVDGVTGFVVDPCDVEEIRERIIALLEDKCLRERMGNAARALIESRVGLDVQAQRLRRLLCSVDPAR